MEGFWIIVIIVGILLLICKSAGFLDDKPNTNTQNTPIQQYPHASITYDSFDDSDEDDAAQVVYSKIAGVTFDNEDGTSRQELLEICEVGDELILEHTPTEKHPTAISIFNEGYEQLGFVKSDLSEKVMDWLLEDRILSVTIADLTGGTPDKPTIGCNYKIIVRSYED